MVKPSYRIYAAILCLAVLGAIVAPPPARAQEPGEEEGPVPPGDGLDVFFVVDNSGSMRRLDPQGLRIAYAHVLTDLLLSRGGDRASVVRLGGRLESEEWKESIVFPLTLIPENTAGRGEQLEAVKKALSYDETRFANLMVEVEDLKADVDLFIRQFI